MRLVELRMNSLLSFIIETILIFEFEYLESLIATLLHLATACNLLALINVGIVVIGITSYCSPAFKLDSDRRADRHRWRAGEPGLVVCLDRPQRQRHHSVRSPRWPRPRGIC
jgi:hypothetical protein